MAKELTRDDVVRNQYSYLVKINQRLKNVCSCYYIHPDGKIYMKSLVDFIEIVGELRYPEKIDLFLGCMILPNKFFEFTKVAKKTKMKISEYEKDGTKVFHFTQENDKEPFFVEYHLNIVNPEKNPAYVYKITPDMYRRYFELNDEAYTHYSDESRFYSFTDVDVNRLLKDPIILDLHGTALTITKQLFLDLKKGDNLAIARMCYRPIDKTMRRVFYDVKHTTELYETHTIFNTISTSRS